MASGIVNTGFHEPPNGRVRLGLTPATNEVLEAELLKCLITEMTLREASEVMRASYWKIRKIAKQPSFLLKVKEKSEAIAQRMMDELVTGQQEFAKRLEEASSQALDAMIDMMDKLTEPSVLKYKIAQDMLDRDPRASRTKRLDMQASHEFISGDVLTRAAQAAREIQRSQVIDVNPTDTSAGHTTDSGNGQS